MPEMPAPTMITSEYPASVAPLSAASWGVTVIVNLAQIVGLATSLETHRLVGLETRESARRRANRAGQR
ncbi:hypothetical protein MUNTM_11700 [Mycobacterium sp. MUNTM1]